MTITVYTPRPGQLLVQIDPVDTMRVPLEMQGEVVVDPAGTRFCTGILVDAASYEVIMTAWGATAVGVPLELPNGECVSTPSPAGDKLRGILEALAMKTNKRTR